MRTLLRLLAPAGAVGLFTLLLTSACSSRAASNGQVAAGVPQPSNATGSQPAAPPPTPPAAADGTPQTPLTGRAIKCQDGKIVAFECENVELLSFLPKDSIGKSSGTDLWGWHDSTTGREYMLIGGASTAFVDVTDPLNPKYLGVLPPHGGITRHAAQSVKVYQHYALIGYEGVNHGIQIFDLSQLRNVPNPPVEFQETAHYAGVGNTHTITMNQATGFAYVSNSNTCSRGLHMIDVRTPTKPTFVGCYPEPLWGKSRRPGYIHDAQCVIYRGPDQPYKGREICVNYAGDGFGIVDVTDKQNPKKISSATYPDAALTHQGWFTEDQRYIFINDEWDEGKGRNTRTIAFDLDDLDDPVMLTEYFNPKTTVTDHNLYIRGRYMYQGNYGAGLRIIDIADPKNPKEVGYLTKIGQAWGTYPYFKNDVVAVSTSTGLFLARLQTR